MPWTLNNNQYSYNYDPDAELSPDQNFYVSQASSTSENMKNADELEYFLRSEVLKDITFTHINENGVEEEKTLKASDTLNYLQSHTKPFGELGRENVLGINLMGFAIKNGMTIEQLDILRTNPNHPNYQEYKQNLENARKDMFKVGTCEEPEMAKQGAVNFYAEYCKKFETELGKIKSIDQGNDKDLIAFNKLAGGFQSLLCQSLNLGEKKAENRAYGQEIVDLVNQKLMADGKSYTFDNVFNFGSLANIINQSAYGIREMEKTGVQFDSSSGYLQAQGEMLNNKLAFSVNEFRNQMRDPNKSVADIICSYDTEGYNVFYQKIQNAYSGQNLLSFGDPDAYIKMEAYEAQRQDMAFDAYLLSQGDQKTSTNFKSDLESLVNGFASIDMKKAGAKFNSLVGSAKYIADCTKKGLQNDQMVQMLRAVQNDANKFILQESTKENPNAQQLRFAKNLFKLTGTEKITLRDNLQRGLTLKGAEVDSKDILLDERELDLGKITTLAKELESVDPTFLISSTEFRDTKKALYSLKDELGKYQKNPSDEELEKVRNAYKKVADNCQLYTMSKTGKQLNERGQKRFDYINKLNSFVYEKFTGISAATNKHIYTNAEMADKINGQAFDKMTDEYNKEKPNMDKVKTYIAEQIISRRIKALDKNAVFNDELPKKLLPEVLKTKEVEKQLNDFKITHDKDMAKKNNSMQL